MYIFDVTMYDLLMTSTTISCNEAATITREYIAPGPLGVAADKYDAATLDAAFAIDRDHGDAVYFHEVCPHCGRRY